MKVALREISYKVIEIDDDQLITQADAARILGVSIAAVRNHMDTGNLPTVQIPPKSRRYTLKDAVIEFSKNRE